MENVNNLNGVPNFGHGYEEAAGASESEESDERVLEGEVALGEQEGAESAEPKASNRNRSKRGRTK